MSNGPMDRFRHDLPAPPISRSEYERWIEAGVLRPEDRLELIDGALVEVTPQSGRHANTVERVRRALERRLAPGFLVRDQKPLALDDRSEPEPDIALVRGTLDDYEDDHPRTAVLVVEVAGTSLPLDRGSKLALYAGAAIPEHWIVNLDTAELEVWCGPARGSYRQHDVLDPTHEIRPPGTTAPVPVGELLPRARG